MPAPDIPQLCEFTSRRSADDAYTAWFNVQRRCTEALRAWQTAASDDRAAAYRTYVAWLDLEEAAAVELARMHALWEAA